MAVAKDTEALSSAASTGSAARPDSAEAVKTGALASTARRRQHRSAQGSGVNLVLVVLTVLTLLATLDVLTGELRDQFETDLDAQVVPSYLEVSATTRVDNITVGLQSINDEQTEAVVVAYGMFVVKSVVSGQQGSPEGSECAVTPQGEDACVQTLQLNLDKVDGTWLVNAVTTITTA